MNVYVDPIAPCLPNANWRWQSSCHMYADTEDELHAFAARLGLWRSWFQTHPTLDHYDLTEGKRRQAVRLGAIEVNKTELMDHVRRKRGETTCNDTQGHAVQEGGTRGEQNEDRTPTTNGAHFRRRRMRDSSIGDTRS
jgi:hypothetical protein